MLAADPKLDARTRRASALDGDPDEITDALLVQAHEGVLIEDALLEVGRQEAPGVVPADAEGGLGQVIGAEGEEFSGLCEVCSPQGSAGQFDHGPDLVFDDKAALAHDRAGDPVGKGPEETHFLALRDQGVHDLRDRSRRSALGDLAGGLEDRPDLHLVDLGIGDAEAAATVAQHGVGFVQFAHPAPELIGVQSPGFRDRTHVRLGLGQELVERGIQKADGDWQSLHDGEQFDEVCPLHGKDLLQRRAPSRLVVGEDHLAHRLNPVLVEEHVFGTAKADALGPKLTCHPGVEGGLGIGADAQAAEDVRPAHQGRKVTGEFRLDHVDKTGQNVTPAAVDRDHVPRPDGSATGLEHPCSLIDPDVAGTGNAGPAHAPGHHRGVTGHAAAGGNDPPGGVHSVDVLRAGFFPDEDHRLARAPPSLGLVGVEDHRPGGGARRGGKPTRHDVARAGRIDRRVK